MYSVQPDSFRLCSDLRGGQKNPTNSKKSLYFGCFSPFPSSCIPWSPPAAQSKSSSGSYLPIPGQMCFLPILLLTSPLTTRQCVYILCKVPMFKLTQNPCLVDLLFHCAIQAAHLTTDVVPKFNLFSSSIIRAAGFILKFKLFPLTTFCLNAFFVIQYF